MSTRKFAEPAANTRRRLIVVEAGASASPEVDGAYDETVVVAQLAGEPSIAFADRALHRLAATEQSHEPFHQAILCAAESCEDDTRASRRLIALALASHAASSHTLGELVVCAPVDTSREERDSLMSLADDLVSFEGLPQLPIRMRFLEPPQLPAGAVRKVAEKRWHLASPSQAALSTTFSQSSRLLRNGS